MDYHVLVNSPSGLVAFVYAPVSLLKLDQGNLVLLYGEHSECSPVDPDIGPFLSYVLHPGCLLLKGGSILYLYNCMVSHELLCAH